jgi:hypothetical protein
MAYQSFVMRKRKQRFKGAGVSAEREFSRRRRRNIRDDWRTWLFAFSLLVAFAVWSLIATGMVARLMAAMAGLVGGTLFVMWSLGGHISAFHWWLGAEGERDTAKQIEQLGPEWHCEHDLEHGRGNWDHVLVGPAGVFLLDSKVINGTAAAGDDALRSGRLNYPGGIFRSGAKQVKDAIEARLGSRAPWVQAVVIIWGDFPQAHHQEQDVVYLRGEQMIAWLVEQPQKLNGPQRAALTTALREARASLTACV